MPRVGPRRPLRAASIALPFALLAGAAAASPIGAEGVRLAPATPGAVRFTVTVPPPRLTRVDPEQRVDRLELPGYVAESDPGTPAIPARTLLVAVPPLGEVRLTAVATELSVRDGVTLASNPGLDAQGHAVPMPRKLAAYGAAGTGTPAAARLLGVTWMRNQRVARVAIAPVAYEPAARRLTVAGRVDVELSVAPWGSWGPRAEAIDPFETVYRLALVNYEQGRAWRRPQAQIGRAHV